MSLSWTAMPRGPVLTSHGALDPPLTEMLTRFGSRDGRHRDRSTIPSGSAVPGFAPEALQCPPFLRGLASPRPGRRLRRCHRCRATSHRHHRRRPCWPGGLAAPHPHHLSASPDSSSIDLVRRESAGEQRPVHRTAADHRQRRRAHCSVREHPWPDSYGCDPWQHGVARRGPPMPPRRSWLLRRGGLVRSASGRSCGRAGSEVRFGGLGDDGGQGLLSVGFLLGGVDDHGPRSG